MSFDDLWTFSDDGRGSVDLPNHSVEAEDGPVGSVDEAGSRTGDGFIVVELDRPDAPAKVMIPAGEISAIDLERRNVRVARTRAEVENAPRFQGPGSFGDEHLAEVATHFED